MSKAPESKFQSFLAARTTAVEPSAVDGNGTTGSKLNARGRSYGKRSDPSYEQVTAYIRKRTHDAVKMALLKEGQRRQFSELVEELLSSWMQGMNI
jgi:hypothetical protein